MPVLRQHYSVILIILTTVLTTDQTVAVHGEGHGVQQGVDRRNNLLTILTCRAVLDSQAPRDKIILNIHDHKGRLRLDDLQTLTGI